MGTTGSFVAEAGLTNRGVSARRSGEAAPRMHCWKAAGCDSPEAPFAPVGKSRGGPKREIANERQCLVLYRSAGRPCPCLVRARKIWNPDTAVVNDAPGRAAEVYPVRQMCRKSAHSGPIGNRKRRSGNCPAVVPQIGTYLATARVTPSRASVPTATTRATGLAHSFPKSLT